MTACSKTRWMNKGNGYDVLVDTVRTSTFEL